MTFISTILTTLACVGISYFVWNYCRRIFFIRKEIILPGPRNLLFRMKNFLRGTSDEALDILIMLTKNYPSPFQISMHSIPIVIVYEPNQVKAILQSQYCLEKNIFYKFIKPIFGTGLLTVPAFIWKQNRKIITSRDSPTVLREFFDILVEQSLIFANELEKIILNGNEIIFLDHMTRCVESIASGVMIKMGIKMESDKKDQFFKAVARLKEILKHRMYFVWLNDFLFYNVIFNLTALGREQQKILKLMESLITEEIQQQPKLNNLQIINKKFFKIFMKIFCKRDFIQETIRNDVITIIMASDKINVTINFVIFMLANFPEIQEKVYKELSEICVMETPMSAPVKYDDLQHMHYLDRVIKETMRLFPAIPVISRHITEDMKISESILPKDTDVIILFIQMYRNEEYWPNPLKFDPDRFLPERIKDSWYHIPFSDGLRNCIGIKYAMIFLKVILAILIRKFVFKTDKNIGIDKIKLKMDVTLSTVEPLKVRLEKRDL